MPSFSFTTPAVAGSCSNGVLDRLPPGFVASASLTVSNTGSITLSGSVTCPALQSLLITIERLNGGNLQATLDNSGLHFSNWQVRAAGVFNAAVSLPAWDMNSDGSFNIAVNGAPAGFTVAGYGFTSVNFSLNRSVIGTLSISGFNGTLFNVSDFNQQFTGGTINNAGSVVMIYNGAVTLGGFSTGAGGQLALRNSGLTVIGTLNLSVVPGVTGSLTLSSLTIPADGNYNLNVATTLSISSYQLDANYVFNLRSSGITGSPNLDFGGQAFRLNGLVITPTGLSVPSPTIAVGSLWYRPWNPEPIGGTCDIGDIWGGFKGTVTLNVSGGGSVSATCTANFAWWVGRFCSDPHPDDVLDSRLDSQRIPVGPVTIGSNGVVSFVKSVFNTSWHEEANWSFDLW